MSNRANKAIDTDPLVKAICDYLRQDATAQHKPALRAELIEIIQTKDLSAFALSNAVRSSDPDIIRAVVVSGADLTRIPTVKDFIGISFKDIEKSRRVETFELLAQHIKPTPDRIEYVGRQALIAKDLDLLKAILIWAPDISFEKIVWQTQFLEDSTQQAPEFWADIFARLDMQHPDSMAFAAKLVTQKSSVRLMAIMMALNLPIYRLIAENPMSDHHDQSWLERFRERAGSAHGELYFRRIMPSVEDVITMSKEHLVALLAGLSNRQKRKIETLRRKGQKVPQSLIVMEHLAEGSYAASDRSDRC